jgi:hypothetical protein
MKKCLDYMRLNLPTRRHLPLSTGDLRSLPESHRQDEDAVTDSNTRVRYSAA